VEFFYPENILREHLHHTQVFAGKNSAPGLMQSYRFRTVRLEKQKMPVKSTDIECGILFFIEVFPQSSSTNRRNRLSG